MAKQIEDMQNIKELKKIDDNSMEVKLTFVVSKQSLLDMKDKLILEKQKAIDAICLKYDSKISDLSEQLDVFKTGKV